MYQYLTARVPLFSARSPISVRASFMLFVLVWFLELNESLHMLSLTKFIPANPRQHFGFVLMCVMWGGWQLLNIVFLSGIAWRQNWARVIELVITIAGMVLLLTTLLLNQGFDPGLLYFANAAATVLLFVPSAAHWFGGSQNASERDD